MNLFPSKESSVVYKMQFLGEGIELMFVDVLGICSRGE